jgi:hypothetical protein
MSNIVTKTVTLPATTSVNAAVLAKVSERMPELVEKTKAFDRSNSQSTLQMMTLTMMNGQSPMRMLRQILAEVEKRKMALAEAQLSHAKLVTEIEELSSKPYSLVNEAELRLKNISLDLLENKVNGAFKDIASLADAYDAIKTKNNILDWDESTFEAEEKQHHVRRGFELLYHNLVECSRAKEATIEYLQQYGVHVQIALAEVSGYINYTNERIKNQEIFSSADLEEFLDAMAAKYSSFADEISERIFGKVEMTNKEYMMLTSDKNQDKED